MASERETNERKTAKPRFVFVLSGKRKSGKDYVAEQMLKRFGEDKAVIIRLSGPLKYQYALEHDLDFDKLLDSSSYKEKYREDMILWGEEQRNRDPGYFCRHAVKGEELDLARGDTRADVWIVSDARRATDMDFFKERYGRVIGVRIEAGDDVRKTRGYKFTSGVDDAPSECGLDDYRKWDYLVKNDGNEENVNDFLKQIQSLV